MGMDLAKDMELEVYDDYTDEPAQETTSSKDLSLFYGEVYREGAWMRITPACETSVEAKKLALAWIRKNRKEKK